MIGQNASRGAEHQAPADAEAWPTAGRAWGAVGLLMAAYFMAYIDRSIFSLLVEPIKHSLHLSDTQIGLLQGVAFGLFFMVMTFPAGWFADRGNRMRLVAWGIACWSIMTALCGLCASFPQLFLARMGVATGEATLTPAGPSVISDNFPPERRTLPMTVYALGAVSGAGVALITGGLVASLVSGRDTIAVPGVGSFEPWQIIFFAVGLPGLVLSVMFALMREPRRRDQGQPEGSLRELVAVIKSRRAILIPHFAGVTLYQVYAYAFLAWLPAFLMRVHGWSMTDVGLKYGVIHVAFGLVGATAGGAVARKLWQRGRRDANLLTGALFFGAMVTPAILGTMVSDAMTSAVLLASAMGFASGPIGSNVAALQEIIPNRLRGRVTAIYYAIIALGGVTLGPLIIGLMNDHLFVGDLAIGKSMSLTALVTLPSSSALLFIAARRRTKLDWAN